MSRSLKGGVRSGLSVLCGGLFALGALAGAVASVSTIPADTMDDLRRRLTTCAMPGLGCAPAGVFLHQRAVDAPLGAAFGLPDPDTLLSSAWLDLSHGPVDVVLPATGQRFFAMQVLSDRGDRAALLTPSTAGRTGATLRVAGPADATGAPSSIQPGTDHAWVVVRLAVHGEIDEPAVHALQDALHLSQREHR